MPKVSVIVPSYNHAPYISRRVESVLNQTFKDFELLILDDASTDKSAKIIRKFDGRPGVTLHFNERNSGSVFRQWQKGFSLATGEYIWVAESDDWADPRLLARLVAVLDENPQVGVAYAQSFIANVDSKLQGDASNWTEDLHPTRWKNDFIGSGRQEIATYLVYKNTIPNASAALMRASVLKKIPPPDASYRLCGDWLHWIRMLNASDVAFVAEPLNYWRLNSSNARTAAPGTLEWLEGEKVLSQAADLIGLDEAEKNKILMAFLSKCWGWQKGYIEANRKPRSKHRLRSSLANIFVQLKTLQIGSFRNALARKVSR